MKKKMVLLVASLGCMLTIGAKDLKTVTCSMNPKMRCVNCENKIKENLRFEKGVKAIETNLEKQTVTVTYDADKTNVDNIIKGFAKIKYQATVVPPAEEKTQEDPAEKK